MTPQPDPPFGVDTIIRAGLDPVHWYRLGAAVTDACMIYAHALPEPARQALAVQMCRTLEEFIARRATAVVSKSPSDTTRFPD